MRCRMSARSDSGRHTPSRRTDSIWLGLKNEACHLRGEMAGCFFASGAVGPVAETLGPCYRCFMQVEKLKYIIWAKEMERAVRFYCQVFDAQIVRRSDVMAELTIAGSLLGIHGG